MCATFTSTFLQATSSAQQMAEAGADAASSAVDRVADAEQSVGEPSTNGLGTPHAVFEASDAVLQQRTYFVPTMVHNLTLDMLLHCHFAYHNLWSVLAVRLLPCIAWMQISLLLCSCNTMSVQLPCKKLLSPVVKASLSVHPPVTQGKVAHPPTRMYSCMSAVGVHVCKTCSVLLSHRQHMWAGWV